MQLIKAVIPASGVAPIIPQDAVIQRNASFQTVVIGAAAHTIYVGDSTVTAIGPGIAIAVGAPALVIPTAVLTQNLNGWYVAGTAADVVTILLLE